MNINDELNQQIKECRESIYLSECVDRLLNNKDFNEIFTKHYMNSYALSLVYALSQYNKDSKEYIQLLSKLEAISYVHHYLIGLIEKGQLAKLSLYEASSIPDSETE